jgi:hypothetical protein
MSASATKIYQKQLFFNKIFGLIKIFATNQTQYFFLYGVKVGINLSKTCSMLMVLNQLRKLKDN